MIVKNKTSYPETVSLIKAVLENNNIDTKLADKFLYAPTEHTERIILSILRKQEHIINRPAHKIKRNKNTKVTNRQLEMQKYNCAYDQYPMELENKGHARYRTIEHIVRLADGGSNSSHNTVMVCHICNMMRDRKNMTAYEFYDWAQINKKAIEDCSVTFMNNKNRKSYHKLMWKK